MYSNILKIFIIFFCSSYINQKILQINSRKNIYRLFNFTLSVLLALLSFYIDSHISTLNYAVPVSIFWLINSILTLNPQITFISTIVSFVISFCAYAISSIFALFIIFPFYNTPTDFPHYLLAIISGIIQTLVCKSLLNLKRFKNGMPFLYHTNIINYSTILCLMFFSFIIYMTSNYEDLSYQAFALLIFLFSLAFLIYWWQAQITKSYRRSLELRELESLRTEVAELNLMIQKLKDDNEHLARITHRDNTLITTLKNSTTRYLVTDFENPADAIAVRDKLIQNINALSEGRTSFSDNQTERQSRIFHTNLTLLDELLHHMDEKAAEQNIVFSVHLGITLTDFVPTVISENDLVHIVDDLLKNAFKATLSIEKRLVQLQFYKLGKHFVIEVADNGIPFEIESLVNLGREKLTTYADGSGIGLMDIWNTKEHYRATYHIDEYETSTSFSKKISLTFDNKNRYSIRTWRKDAILQNCKRIDLQVYNHTE